MSERCANTLLAANGLWPPYFFGVMVFTATCNLIASAACIYVVISILSNRYTRGNTFNLYVAFLLVPDSINAFFHFLTGVFRTKNCAEFGPNHIGDAYDFNVSFYYMCNFSLNCMVAWELNSLLAQAHRFSRAGPPPLKQTLRRIFGVYSFALLFAIWGSIDVPWSWYYRGRSMFGSPPGGLFTELQAIVMVGSLMMLMLLFVVAIRIRIWWKGILPNNGRARVVITFFERIIVAFLVFYFPMLALLMVSTMKSIYSHEYFWIERSLHLLSALQVAVTLWAVSRKPDIHEAILRCDGGRTNQQRSESMYLVASHQRVSIGSGSHPTRTTRETSVEQKTNSVVFAAVAAAEASPNDASRQTNLSSDHFGTEVVTAAFLSLPFQVAETEWKMMDVDDSDDGAADEENSGGSDSKTSIER